MEFWNTLERGGKKWGGGSSIGAQEVSCCTLIEHTTGRRIFGYWDWKNSATFLGQLIYENMKYEGIFLA